MRDDLELDDVEDGEDGGQDDAFKPLVTVPDQTANRNQMAELHQLICLALSARIRSGMWSSGDIAAAAKFLKDNNVTADVGDNEALQALRDNLQQRQKARLDAKKGVSLTADEMAQIAMDEVSKDVWH